MNTTNDAPSFWERLRDYPYDFVAHFMNLLYGVVLTNGLLEADYIVGEMARKLLGESWMQDYVARANAGGIERVLV